MNVIVLAPTQQAALAWQYQVEDLGADWRCTPAATAQQARSLAEGADVLLLLPGPEGAALLSALMDAPPLAPPYILGDNAPDGPLPPPQELPQLAAAWQRDLVLPALCHQRLPAAQDMAAAFLRILEVPPRLRACDFLPDMLALTVVHPPLLQDLQHRLYPLTARRHGMTAAGVERSLRLCVESTWMHGSLAALERFFGLSVDPEKGKPTNRAFLRRAQQQLTSGLMRLVTAP